MHQLTNQMYAAMAVVGLGLLATIWYILPAGGSYDVENDKMTFPVTRTDRSVVPASAALEPLVPEATEPRKYNPFTRQVQLHRNEADTLDLPPAPPLTSTFPEPLPLPAER